MPDVETLFAMLGLIEARTSIARGSLMLPIETTGRVMCAVELDCGSEDHAKRISDGLADHFAKSTSKPPEGFFERDLVTLRGTLVRIETLVGRSAAPAPIP